MVQLVLRSRNGEPARAANCHGAGAAPTSILYLVQPIPADMRLSVDCLFLRSPSRVLYRTELIPRAQKWRRLSVDCLFLRSPSRVLYRTELSESRLECRISKCRISIQSVDCLFLRSPSRVLYRMELIPRASQPLYQ